MSHHSPDKSLDAVLDEAAKEHTDTSLLEKQLQDTLGPTGQFPAGRLVAQDEGGLIFGVSRFNGRVIIDFGKPVRSIGFTKTDALNLAETLIAHANACVPIIGEKTPNKSGSGE